MPEDFQEDTLLLVDPDLDFLDWATKHLSAKNLRVLRCDNAANAVKVIEKTPVSVVVAAMELLIPSPFHTPPLNPPASSAAMSAIGLAPV